MRVRIEIEEGGVVKSGEIEAITALREEKRALEEKVAEQVEAAWREGVRTGNGTDNYFPDEWWPRSNAHAALAAQEGK